MKRLLVLLFALTISAYVCSCGNKKSQPENSVSETVQAENVTEPEIKEPSKLVNKMTEAELSKVDKHALTLLDEPEESTTEAEPEQTEHTVSVEFHTPSIDELRESIESYRDQMTDEEYEEALDYIEDAVEKGENGGIPYPDYILVDGYIVSHHIPYSDPDYDGGQIEFILTTMSEDGEIESEELSFESFEVYLDWIRKEDAGIGYSDEEIELDILHVQLANEALKTGDYEILPEGTVDVQDRSLYFGYDESGDYRDTWEFDREAVEAIKDSVDEISIYDEELDEEFVVHVTLPPDYDKDKTYPVFFLTDGIWRFGNCPELRKVMENGEAAPVILVSLYYSYNITDPDGSLRYYDFVANRDKLLDFITDNLMPYLCESYNIDCESSALYGHSDGGVFSHNALFKSDLYENQPFGSYIIGSPALWGLYNYNEHFNISSDEVMNDYGYFDRNDKLDKKVFLCGGDQEDPDYADNYNGHDTTLEGLEKLRKRLEAKKADMTYKLYDSHHYQYIPEMLIEYLKENYPV